jgi:hypothetical protein
MYYYSSVKKNKLVSLSRKCMELELIMLKKIVRLRKTSIACFLSYQRV